MTQDAFHRVMHLARTQLSGMFLSPFVFAYFKKDKRLEVPNLEVSHHSFEFMTVSDGYQTVWTYGTSFHGSLELDHSFQ